MWSTAIPAEYRLMSATGRDDRTSIENGQQTVREGRIARARGVERAANPYPPPMLVSSGGTVADHKLAARLRAFWWIGWDQADRELRHPPDEDSAA